jgi:photosystem II stability/assembly factor-like uncharacterized protein
MFQRWLFPVSVLLLLSTTAAFGESDSTPNFVKIRFVDHDNGWARTETGILRTTDGGRNWKNILAAGFVVDDRGVGVAFRSDDSVFPDYKAAWVASIQGETATVSFRHTADGGAHWSGGDFTPLQSESLLVQSNLAFADDHNGWLMLAPDHGMNSSPGFLYRTKNGGKTWRQVASTDDRLPHGGAIFFRDASVGWLVGADTDTSENSLSITRDGGATWKFQKLPPPRGRPESEVGTDMLPVLFGPERKDGILVVFYSQQSDGGDVDSGCTLIYTTHDGGDTWQSTVSVRESENVVDFINARSGWTWIYDPDYKNNHEDLQPVKGTLYKTDDSGQTWLPIKGDAALAACLAHGQDVVQLDFVDGNFGWACLQDGDCKVRSLLQTTNGGKTWSDLHARIEP